MFRTLAAIGLIGLLFSNVFLKSFVFLNFKIHQEVISQTLCVQKDEVKNTCNGKCHLAKQLEKSEEGSEESPAVPENIHEALLYFAQDSELNLEEFEETVRRNPRTRPLLGISSIHSIFHPPQVV